MRLGDLISSLGDHNTEWLGEPQLNSVARPNLDDRLSDHKKVGHASSLGRLADHVR